MLLALDLWWYAVLLVAEFVRRRPRYGVRRWATVFPMGMTAAGTPTVVAALGPPWLEVPGEVLLWIAVAAWPAVSTQAVAAARAGLGTAAGEVRSTAPR